MSDEEFRRTVEAEAGGQGRQLKYIRLFKPDGASLGFRWVKYVCFESCPLGQPKIFKCPRPKFFRPKGEYMPNFRPFGSRSGVPPEQ